MDEKQRSKIIHAVRDKVFAADNEYQRYAHSSTDRLDAPPVDFLFAFSGEVKIPDEAFDRLRWGGQLIYAGLDPEEVARTAETYTKRREFTVETSLGRVTEGLPLPGMRRTYYYFVARKILLVRPGEFSDRFTNHVELIRHPAVNRQYVVHKEIPSLEGMEQRLSMKFPELEAEDIKERARTFCENVFPLFLTRETGILKVLEKYLPEKYRSRVPRVVEMYKNERGFVTKFAMTWLRNGTGGKPIPHLEFARQTADLLRVVHDDASVIHLDLRPDNIVVTQEGVGFIDFGSSVRVGEDLSKSKTLMKMFEQVMITSQIQKTLGQMSQSGVVTSRVIRNGYRKVDKAVDLFFMVLQMNAPLSNPDFQGLIDFDPNRVEAKALSELTTLVLKPKDADNPVYKTAVDVLNGVQQITKNLGKLTELHKAQQASAAAPAPAASAQG